MTKRMLALLLAVLTVSGTMTACGDAETAETTADTASLKRRRRKPSLYM